MAKRPDLLFIFTDEQRFDTMRCYGNEYIRTPNLDRLADESFVFENAYVTQPVCSPSRATIMTGQWPHTNGCLANNVPLRPQTRTIAEMLDEEYLCAYFGKWHLGDEVIAQHGFDQWLSIEDMYRRHYSKDEYLSRMSDYHHFLVENGFQPDRESRGARVFSRTMAAKLPEPYTKAAFLGSQAARFIHENRNQPFALYVNFLEPHMPFTGPYDELYPPESLTVGPQFRRPPGENASLLHRRMSEHYMSNTTAYDVGFHTDAGVRKVRAQYMGLVTLVDNAVGVILSALEQAGLADDTIVVFTSDHGDMMGDHGLMAKTVMYEEALKVPWFMRVPALGRRQRRIPGRISQIDLVPTLLELMDQRPDEELEGVSRAGVLGGEATLADNDVFVEWNGQDTRGAITKDASAQDQEILAAPWRTVISADGWKLNLSGKDQSEMYDLNSDPCELSNLFNDPGQTHRIRDLAGCIAAWQQRTGDTVPLPVV